jgi:hypothetical protein
MGKKTGLEALMAFWNSMTNAQRRELSKNLSRFTSLVHRLKIRGIIKTDHSMSKIVILKRDPEIKRLKELLKLTGAQGITIIKKAPLLRAGPLKLNQNLLI